MANLSLTPSTFRLTAPLRRYESLTQISFGIWQSIPHSYGICSTALSFLAQGLFNISPQSPQAWIAIGNLFSLQKEQSQALTCFRHAAQRRLTCAHASTLSGHELIDEDLDKAIDFFQFALRADSRQYNTK